MDELTPDQARARFGEILHASTRTYREFEDADGGLWRPVYNGGDLIAYRRYKLIRVRKPRSLKMPPRRR